MHEVCLRHIIPANCLSDRELTLVPKKGRPVTQCQHCRVERKKRSAHVKCDCGETDKPHHPKEKCIHLREAEERVKLGYHDDHTVEHDSSYLAAVAEEQGCCCHHGGKCTCAILKKETGDDVTAPLGPAVKPRLEKTTSEGATTVFTNGHHKPVHRKNYAAHECGLPYKLPMPRSNPEDNVFAAAHRSVDSLALDNNTMHQPSAFTPQTSAPFNNQRRRSKSEQPSPKIPALSASCSGLGDAKLASIDFSGLAENRSDSSVHSAMSDNYFPTLDPMSGVTEQSFDPWSAFPSADSSNGPNNNAFDVWPTSNDSISMAQPALTAASSGTQSEIDEMPPMDEVYGIAMPNIEEDADNFSGANMASGNSPQSNRRSLPPGFFGNTDLRLDGLNNEWQSSTGNFGVSPDNKAQNSTFDSVWPMPSGQTITSVPQRAIGASPSALRPQSRSVGSSSAPNDEIIRSLFPDIDISSGTFGYPDSAQANNMRMDKTLGGLSSSSGPTSAPIGFGQMHDTVGFTSQPWSDVPMGVPNDALATSYALDQDFQNPQFTENWPQ